MPNTMLKRARMLRPPTPFIGTPVAASLCVVAVLWGAGCTPHTSATPRDAGHIVDAGLPVDAGLSPDAGHPRLDGGPAFVPREDAVGGALTVTPIASAPFLTPANGLDVGTLSAFSLGRELFAADWVAGRDPSRARVDGLGPLFHTRNCLACHPGSGRPASLLPQGGVAPGLLVRLARPVADGWAPDGHYGGQFQPRGTGDVPGEGRVGWRAGGRPAGYDAVAATSPVPVFLLTVKTGAPALDEATALGPRQSPHLAGMGLLDAVPDAVILEAEDPDDADGDGISGRAAWLEGDAGPVLGRFGWKAIHTSVRAQSAGAFAGDMGITSPLQPADDCTAGQSACLMAGNGGDVEVDDAGLDAVTTFLAHLGVPAARYDADDPAVQRGARVFRDIQCQACHRQTLRTAPDAPALLGNQVFHPYTDLLLHDMGPALRDGIGEGAARPGEWRTPPLWGLGLVAEDPAARFLHDGRATSLDDAIRWHGGEAAAAKDAYRALEQADRDALLTFLRGL